MFDNDGTEQTWNTQYISYIYFLGSLSQLINLYTFYFILSSFGPNQTEKLYSHDATRYSSLVGLPKGA
jgi:hypothetical protein